MLLGAILYMEVACVELEYELAMDRVKRGLTETLPLAQELYEDYGDERILVLFNSLKISIEILNGNL